MSTGVLKSSTTELCVRCTTNKPASGARRCRTCQNIVNSRQKELRAAQRSRGLCTCGRQAPKPGTQQCTICDGERNKSRNQLRNKNRQQGLCACGQSPTPGHGSCQACRIQWAEKNARKRWTVLEHYGLACKCCGEDTYEFLEIDHVDGDGTGNDNRREIPPGFQTLCSNCNRAKFRYGVCPHQRKRTEEKTT
jgi:hypothetical protein